MQTIRTLGASLLGAAVLLGPALAQEEKPQPKKPKKIRAMGPALRLTAGGRPQPKSQEELKQLFEDKMAESWVENAAWITDYDKAQAEAKTSGRKIFAYFTRSYAP
ncbi:MAG: hypothetical protein ACYTGW_19625 [Planctomycetota bacterium]|jgi:hypothetical protein